MVISGPNLTIDRTVALDELRAGEVLRFADVAVAPGGKGVDVARTARALGRPALLVGFLPGHTGAACAAMLADEGIALSGVAVHGELRSTSVVLERSGRVTVFNEPGPRLGADDWERFELAVAVALGAAPGSVLACSGSLPPGAPDDGVARLVALAAARQVAAIVDIGGIQLEAALHARPALVTPNLAEAEGLLHGRADETVETGEPAIVARRALAASRELVARGAVRAVVTAAAAGAAIAGPDHARFVAAPAVAVVRNPIGAGDALVGGVAAGRERGKGWDASIALGIACGAASVETATAGDLVAERAMQLRAAIAG